MSSKANVTKWRILLPQNRSTRNSQQQPIIKNNIYSCFKGKEHVAYRNLAIMFLFGSKITLVSSHSPQPSFMHNQVYCFSNRNSTTAYGHWRALMLMFHKPWESDPVLQHCLPHKQFYKNSQEKNCGIRAGARTSLPGFAAEENILCHYNLRYFKLCKIYTTLHTHLLSSTQDKQWTTSN